MISFWFALSSFQGPQIWYLIILRFLWIKRWGNLWKSFGHWGSYGLKQGYPLNFLKITHTYLMILFYYHFPPLSHNFKVHIYDIWSYWGFYVVRGEVIFEKVLAIEAAASWNRGINYNFLKITHIFTIKKNCYI